MKEKVMHTKINDQIRKVLFRFMMGGIALFLSLGASGSLVAHAQAAGAQKPYYTVNAVTASDGTLIDEVIINGPPAPPPGFDIQRQAVSLPKPDSAAGINILTVPAFNWVFGCSAVSAAMIAGYYDQTVFPNMYTGPTNGGIMPMNNSSWPTWSDGFATYPNCPLVASKNGVDGRATRGSIDDYWVKYNSAAHDPYITNSWTQHTWGDAIGDYMKTSQSAIGNVDGSTMFYTWSGSGPSSAAPLTCDDMVTYDIHTQDGTYGRKLFYEARGYTVTDCYNQKTDNTIAGGFSFAQLKAEIDAGRPVMLNLEGHTVVAVGYDDSSNQVYIHDTWDYVNHTMTWGGSYSGMALQSVSIVNLYTSPPAPGTVTPSYTAYGSFVDSPFDLTTTFTDNESAVTTCEYCVSTDGACDTEWATGVLSGSSPTWTCTKTGITGTNGQSLTLNMRAASSGGTGTATQITRTVDAAAPTTSDNQTSSNWQATEKTITLTPNDGTGSGVAASTGIYGCLGAGCTPAVLGGNTMTTACGSGNECTYDVRYYSKDNVGNTETTKTSAYQARLDMKAPTDGAALTATPGDAQCSLSWNAATDAGSGLNATHSYKLVYLTGTTLPDATCTNGTEITDVTTGTTYLHTGLTNGTHYSYRVCAIDKTGNVSTGVTASATPLAWTEVNGTREICVTNAAMLQDYLHDAEADGHDNIIKVTQGTYVGLFTYAGDEDFDLLVEGGYNSGCTTRSYSPEGTILDGDLDTSGTGDGVVLDLITVKSDSIGNITVDGLHVKNGYNGVDDGGCIRAYTVSGTTTISGNIAENCAAVDGAGIGVETGSGQIHLSDNMIYGNTASGSGGGIRAATTTGQVVVLNNTITDNVAVNGGGGLAVELYGDTAAADIQNNIIRGNTLNPSGSCADVNIDSDADNNEVYSTVTVDYNDLNLADGICTTNPEFLPGMHNVDADPLYVDPENKDYHLTLSSPLIDAGNVTHPDLSVMDIDGDNRVFNNKVDIGADEYTVTLTSDLPSPQVSNRTITWTATASGGAGALSYKFQTWHSSTGILTPQTGSSNTYAWTPSTAGSNYVKVIVTDTLGQSVDSGWKAYQIINPPLVLSSLSPNPTSPQASNTAITWTATASGGTGALTYKFQTWHSSTGILTPQTGSSNTYAWTPATVGSNYVKVIVTDTVGQSAESGWIAYQITNPSVVLTSMIPNPTSPGAKSTTITWTATASGGVGALTYKFQTWHSSTGILTPQTGSSNTYAWTPTVTGGHYVKVIVTDTIGQSLDSGWIAYQIINPPLVLSSLSPNPTSPQASNTAITWTATASGGVGALTYKFQTWHSSTGILTPQTGSSNTYAWTPATVGSNYVKVIVTDTVGQSADSGWIAYQITNPSVVLTSMTPNPTSPQVANTPITWTATASGGTGALTYKFQTWHSSTGILTPQNGSSNIYAWTPATVGSNYVKVIVTDSIGQSIDSGWIAFWMLP